MQVDENVKADSMDRARNEGIHKKLEMALIVNKIREN